jgi:hypothetical protein
VILLKEQRMRPLKEQRVREGKDRRSAAPARAAQSHPTTTHTNPSMTVAVRRQTPEEQRHWEAAFDVFLAELVRQHLGRE